MTFEELMTDRRRGSVAIALDAAHLVSDLAPDLRPGAIARLVVPGRDPMGLLGTMGLGIVGSYVGGFLENVVFLHTLSLWSLHPSGILGSIIGSIIVLLISRIFGGKRRRRA